MADLISLNFSANFDHCPRFMLSFHSTKFSLSLTFYKGSNYVLKTEMVEMDEIRNLNLT